MKEVRPSQQNRVAMHAFKPFLNNLGKHIATNCIPSRSMDDLTACTAHNQSNLRVDKTHASDRKKKKSEVELLAPIVDRRTKVIVVPNSASDEVQVMTEKLLGIQNKQAQFHFLDIIYAN